MKLALEELKDEDTNRTTMQDTLVGINILEEMNTNNQLITDKLGCQVPEQKRQWVDRSVQLAETNGTHMAAANTVKGSRVLTLRATYLSEMRISTTMTETRSSS